MVYLMHSDMLVNNKKSKRIKALSFSMKMIFTALIMYLVLSSVSIEEYRQLIVLLSLKPILGILTIVILQIFFLASRWYLLAKAAGSSLSATGSIYGILMSFFFSQGLPASIGGDAFRLWWHRREGIATGNALRIIFYDRIYGLFSLVILCSLSLFYLLHLLGAQAKIISIMMLVISCGLLFIILFMPWRLGLSSRISLIYKFMPKTINIILQWISEVRNTLSKQTILTTSILILLGFLTHLLVVIQVYIVGHYLSPEKISFLICFCAVPSAMLVSYMPFSIAGWGVREASMVLTFSLFGISASVAILISLSVGMSILVISLIGGLVWVLGGFRLAYKNNVDAII
jgi:uncharacterized protein (TIRG00374 family)